MAEAADKANVVPKVGDRVRIKQYIPHQSVSGPDEWPQHQVGSEHTVTAVVTERASEDVWYIGLGDKDGTPFFAVAELEIINA